MDEIQKEIDAMENTIPSWEWNDEDDNIVRSLAKEKLKIMFGGGDEN